MIRFELARQAARKFLYPLLSANRHTAVAVTYPLMADNNKARIEAELAGTQQVASEGAKIIGTIKGIGEASTKAGEVSKMR